MTRLQSIPALGRSLVGSAFAGRVAGRWAFSDTTLRQLQASRAHRMLSAAAALAGYSDLNIDRDALSDPLGFLEGVPRLAKEQLRGREGDYYKHWGTIRAATSGTTGTPLTLRRSIASVLEEEAWVMHCRGWAGFRRGDRHVELRGALLPADAEGVPHSWSPELRKLTVSSYHLSHDTAARYAHLWHRYRVDWVMAYPSAVTALLVLAEQQDVALPPVRGVFTSSENLTPENRAFISERLGCPVWDHFGNAERTVAASQCEELRYHFLPGYALVEPDQSALVTTGLTNAAMPLLRYVVTDEVDGWSDETCACGRRGPTVSSIHGRSESFLVGEAGRLIGRMDHVFKALPGVVSGQLHQRLEGHLTVRVVPTNEIPASVLIDQVKERTVSRMGSISVDVEIVDRIEPQPNGKVPFVIQELPFPEGLA